MSAQVYQAGSAIRVQVDNGEIAVDAAAARAAADNASAQVGKLFNETPLEQSDKDAFEATLLAAGISVPDLEARKGQSLYLGDAVDLRLFGPVNQFSTWKSAVAYMNASPAGVVVRVPAGLSRIPRASIFNALDGLLVIRKDGCYFDFATGSRTDYDDIRVPLFVFTATRGGLIGEPNFVFTGLTPVLPSSVSLSQFYAASGVPTGLSFGGEYELWSLVLTTGSELSFLNLSAVSATLDEGHVQPFVLNLKPKTIATRATDNRVSNLRMRGFQHGILYYGQDRLEVDTVKGDFRAGLTRIAPGHLIYATGAGLSAVKSQYCQVRRLIDGPNAINWPASKDYNTGTLAPKGSSRSLFDDVQSYHPSGLLHSVDDAQDCTFQNMQWQTDDAEDSGIEAIRLLGDNQRNTYLDIRLIAPNKLVQMKGNSTSNSSGSTIERVYFKGRVNLPTGSPTGGVFELYGSNIKGIPEIEPTEAPVSPHLFAIQSRVSGSAPTNVATGWRFDVRLSGEFVSAAFKRFADAGTDNLVMFRGGSRSRGDRVLSSDAGGAMAAKRTVILTVDPVGWDYQTVDGGGTGTGSFSFQLPCRGMYDLAVYVTNNTRSDAVFGKYALTFSDLLGVANKVSLFTGTDGSVGTRLSALAVVMDTSGLVTVSYTKSQSFFATTSYGGRMTAGIAS